MKNMKRKTRMTERRYRELERVAETKRDCLLSECLDEIGALKEDIERLKGEHEAYVKEAEWP